MFETHKISTEPRDTHTATQVTPEIFIFYKKTKKTKKIHNPKCNINSDSGRKKQHSLGQKREQVVET